MLVLGLDPGEELDDEAPGPDLVADQVHAVRFSVIASTDYSQPRLAFPLRR
jgi:hypothetical protein